MGDIVVRRVETPEDKKRYFEYPWVLYKDNPYWVPPVKSIRKADLDQHEAAFWEYSEGEFYLAERGGEVVGIIAAFVNHRHNETWHENIAWFGDFHFVDDPAVCAALLNQAQAYAQSKGKDAMRGPATFSLHAEVGVLLDGFDEMPLILMPYNHAYYDPHIRAAGFEKAMDLYNWYGDSAIVTSDSNPAFQKMERVVYKNNERRKITVELGHKKNQVQDFALIRDLYNTAWKDNWGFVPLTDRELDEMIKNLKDFYAPEMTYFAYVDGDPAGYLLAIPDLNQAILKAYPNPRTPEILSLVKILWHWKVRSAITNIRVPLMGIKAKYHALGIDGALLLEAMKTARKVGYARFYGGWVLETNTAMNKICENLGGVVDRHYRIYEKKF